MQWASIFGTSVFGTSMRDIGTDVFPDVLTSEFTPPIETESPDFRTHFGLPRPVWGVGAGGPHDSIVSPSEIHWESIGTIERRNLGQPKEGTIAVREATSLLLRGRLCSEDAFCSEVAGLHNWEAGGRWPAAGIRIRLSDVAYHEMENHDHVLRP